MIARPATAEAIRAGGLINRQGKEEIRVRPRALRVLVPKTANRNLFVQP